jgi:hypothetical protein
MEAEHFRRWEPWWWFRDVGSTSIASVTDDWEGFRLILTADKCPDTRVLVPRGALVLYRVYDELGLLGRRFEGFEPGHCFYTVESSLLAKESSQVHGGTRDVPPARHYAIYTSDRCIHQCRSPGSVGDGATPDARLNRARCKGAPGKMVVLPKVG